MYHFQYPTKIIMNKVDPSVNDNKMIIAEFGLRVYNYGDQIFGLERGQAGKDVLEMDERTKLELIQQLKTEMNGGEDNKDPENCRYIRERNAVESLENRISDAEREEMARIEAVKREKQKKEEEEALFRNLLNQRRQR